MHLCKLWIHCLCSYAVIVLYITITLSASYNLHVMRLQSYVCSNSTIAQNEVLHIHAMLQYSKIAFAYAENYVNCYIGLKGSRILSLIPG